MRKFHASYYYDSIHQSIHQSKQSTRSIPKHSNSPGLSSPPSHLPRTRGEIGWDPPSVLRGRYRQRLHLLVRKDAEHFADALGPPLAEQDASPGEKIFGALHEPVGVWSEVVAAGGLPTNNPPKPHKRPIPRPQHLLLHLHNPHTLSNRATMHHRLISARYRRGMEKNGDFCFEFHCCYRCRFGREDHHAFAELVAFEPFDGEGGGLARYGVGDVDSVRLISVNPKSSQGSLSSKRTSSSAPI